jgi:hypothetical protein
MLTRRKVLLGGLTGMAGLSALAAWRFTSGHDQDAIEMVIRKRLDYLKLDDAGVKAYARDLASRQVVSSSRLHVLNAIAPVYSRFSLSSGASFVANAIRHGEERITSSYLMSSDFFLNGADESRVVKYLGYLDSRRGCSNPFARSPET